MEKGHPLKATVTAVFLLSLMIPGFIITSWDQDIEVEAFPLDLNSIPEIVYDDNVYCFYDDPPVFDGEITASDGWDDTIPTYFKSEYGNNDIRIRAKHDKEKIYILLENKGDYSSYSATGHIEDIYFEDDGTYPERSLDSENEDNKYVGASGAPDGFRDAFRPSSGGWQVDSDFREDGGCLWSTSGDWKVAEWWLYMNTGSSQDISVTGNETLGFAAGWSYGWPGGNIEIYDASEWGSFHVVYDVIPTRIIMTYPEEDALIRMGEEVLTSFVGRAHNIEFQWDDLTWLPMNEGDPILTDGLSDGDHKLDIRCVGNGGNWYNNTFRFCIDSERPEFDGIEVCEQESPSHGILLGWSEAIDEHTPITYNIYVHRSGMSEGEFTLERRTGEQYLTYSNLVKGEKLTFKVRAMDAAGWEDQNDRTMSITPTMSLPPIKDIDLDSIDAVVENGTIFCFQGSTPIIDGVWSGSEGWDEVPATYVSQRNDELWIRSKHDTENIYFLFVSTSEHLPSGLTFEDDGLSPENDLDSQNEDRKYIGVSGYPSGYRDAHWNEGWPIDHVDGGAEASMLGELYTAEFWFPLNSGSPQDINVTSDETLGFGVSGGVDFPAQDYNQYEVSTWGTLHVIYEEYAGDVMFFGPPDGSVVDERTKFGVIVSLKDAVIHYSINDGAWMVLDHPFILTGDVLDQAYNEIDFRFSVDGSLIGTLSVTYSLDLEGPDIWMKNPSDRSSFELPAFIRLEASGDDDIQNVRFYFLDEWDIEQLIGEADYSIVDDIWYLVWYNEQNTDPVTIYAVAWDDKLMKGESAHIRIEFFFQLDDDDDDDIVMDDDDDDIIVDDDDNIVMDDDDDDILLPDTDPHDEPSILLYLVFLIIGIITIIVAVIMAIVMGVKDRRKDKDKDNFFRERTSMTADQARAMTPQYIRPNVKFSPHVERSTQDETYFDENEEEEEFEIPLSEEPVFEEEEFEIDEDEEIDVEEDEEEIGSRLEDDLFEVDDEEADAIEEEEDVLYGKGDQVEKELHDKAKYLKDDGVVGGQIGNEDT